MATQYAKRSFLMVVVSSLLLLSIFTITYAASTIGTNMSTTGTFTQTVGSATAARFQNAAGTFTVLTVDTTNSRVGVGAAPGTTFEVQGTASASYFFTLNTIQVGGTTSSAAYSRFGTNTTTGSFLTSSKDLLVSGKFEVDGSASFDTKIEVQGTASASYFLTANTIQVGGNASVAYSRFGTNTATNSPISGTDDLLISGNLEVDSRSYFDAPAEFQGTASASYFLTVNTIQVGGNASVAYSRFGTTATTHAGTISDTDDLMVGGGFEVNGSAAFDGFAKFGDKASVAGNFQTSGRFVADTAASHSFKGNLNITKTVVVGSATASGSGAYVAEFVGATTTTSSFYFGGGNSATKGSCFQLKDTTGEWIYMRFRNGQTNPTLSTVRCH